MDCSLLGDEQIDCGNNDELFGPDSLRSPKPRFFFGINENLTAPTLGITSFVFCCSFVRFQVFHLKDISLVATVRYLNLCPSDVFPFSKMRFGMSMPGIGRRSP